MLGILNVLIRSFRGRRAYALQNYLLLHSQHEVLQRQQQRRGSLSNAQLVKHTTITRRSSLPALVDESVLREADDGENKLISVIEQIKCTLTDLLNSEGVKNDSRNRMWVQTRLMNAEKELRGFRMLDCERRGSDGNLENS